MGFFDLLGKQLERNKKEFSDKAYSQIRENERKIAEYERRGNLSSEQRNKIDKAKERMERAKNSLDKL